MLAYQYVDLHGMWVYGIVAAVILLVLARIMIGRM